MRKSCVAALAVIFILCIPKLVRAGGIWKSEIPAQARDEKAWTDLLGELRSKGMPFGAMAASARILTFFPDLESKETAYRAVVELMDQGYPFSQREMNALFVPGDLDPRGDQNFVNSYNLSKYLLNHERGLERWAKQYYEKTSGESFSKYQFFLAVTAYSKGNNQEAIERLRKILAADNGEGSGAPAIQSARTLARIYFEAKDYRRSLDIYRSFLLKLNPITPSDWIEAAWNEYYLKHYPESLGLLYNLDSRASGQVVSLEKYMLRALIYRENCASDSAQALSDSFGHDFGPALEGMKQGASPRSFPILASVQSDVSAPYHHLVNQLQALEKESSRIDQQVSESKRALAHYLYSTESKLLQAERDASVEQVTQEAGKQIVMVAEQLKFLKYDVARERFDPDRVFQEQAPAPLDKSHPTLLPSEKDRVHWAQRGEFWRDERLAYQGMVKNQCN